MMNGILLFDFHTNAKSKNVLLDSLATFYKGLDLIKKHKRGSFIVFWLSVLTWFLLKGILAQQLILLRHSTTIVVSW